MKKKLWLYRELIVVLGSALIGYCFPIFWESLLPPFISDKRNIPEISFFCCVILFFLSVLLVEIIRNSDKSMTKEIEKISDWVEMKINFTAFAGQRHEQPSHSLIEKVLDSAERKILILDYNPLDEITDEIEYKVRDRKSEIRKSYYEKIEKKIKNGNECRYVRIVQLQDEKKLSDLWKQDEIFKNHCDEIIRISQDKPEKACIKTCQLLYHGNLFLIDDKTLVIQINLKNHTSGKFSEGGFLVIDGEHTNVLEYFIKIFRRIDLISNYAKLPITQNKS